MEACTSDVKPLKGRGEITEEARKSVPVGLLLFKYYPCQRTAIVLKWFRGKKLPSESVNSAERQEKIKQSHSKPMIHWPWKSG